MAAPKRIDAKMLCEMAIDKVTEIISTKFPQYPLFGDKFKASCIEEAFEERDLLTDDFAEGFAESVILGYIVEDIQIKDNDKEPLCSAIHYILRTYYPPPTSLNLAEIKTNVGKKQIASMTAQLEAEATLLKPSKDNEQALTKAIIVGENNHFPLLIYLVDTFVRFILLDYQKLYKQLNTKKSLRKRTRFIGKHFKNAGELRTFFKRCHAMKQIAGKAKTDRVYEHALLWYEHAIKSFNHRLMPPLKMHPNRITKKINDSLLIYAKYYISMLIAVHNILKNPMTKLPQQIDFWVIPKAMTDDDDKEDINQCDDETNDDNKTNNDDDDDDDIDSDDDDDADDVDDDQNDVISIGLNNIDQRLKYTDNLIVKEVKDREISKLSRCLQGVYENVVKGQRSKRMVMIIDRRMNGKDVTENNKNYCILNENEDEQKNQEEADKLYAFLPKKSQNIPYGHYLHEAMFNLSRLEVLPSENGKVKSDADNRDNNAIHAVSDLLNQNMCLLSIHIHQQNVVRAYWSIHGSSTRFFVNDMVNIWPLFFREKEVDKTYETPIHQDVIPIINLINDNLKRIPLRDTNFDKFFFQNTKIKSAKGEIDKIGQIEETEETEEIQK